MKNLILQVNIPLHSKKSASTFYYDSDMYAASNKSVKEWAHSHGHDYILIEDLTYHHPAFERFRMFNEEWDHYDQIMYVDSDFFVHKMTPNILGWTKERKEEVFLTLNTTTDTETNRKSCKKCKTETYYNSGMMIWKRKARQLVRSITKEAVDLYTKSAFKDQDAINWMLRDKHDLILRLGSDWNDTMAHVRPLFTTHWCGRGKERWNPSHQRKIDLDKCRRIAEINVEDYYLPFKITANALF